MSITFHLGEPEKDQRTYFRHDRDRSNAHTVKQAFLGVGENLAIHELTGPTSP